MKLSCLAPTVGSGLDTAADSLQVAAIQEAAEQIADVGAEEEAPDEKVTSFEVLHNFLSV